MYHENSPTVFNILLVGQLNFWPEKFSPSFELFCHVVQIRTGCYEFENTTVY